jgi:hypothetical protein
VVSGPFEGDSIENGFALSATELLAVGSVSGEAEGCNSCAALSLEEGAEANDAKDAEALSAMGCSRRCRSSGEPFGCSRLSKEEESGDAATDAVGDSVEATLCAGEGVSTDGGAASAVMEGGVTTLVCSEPLHCTGDLLSAVISMEGLV